MNTNVNLQQRIKRLCKKANKLDLYLSFCDKKNTLDTEWLKLEIKNIKSLVLDIENDTNLH